MGRDISIYLEVYHKTCNKWKLHSYHVLDEDNDVVQISTARDYDVFDAIFAAGEKDLPRDVCAKIARTVYFQCLYDQIIHIDIPTFVAILEKFGFPTKAGQAPGPQPNSYTQFSDLAGWLLNKMDVQNTRLIITI